jgi:uncharacterized membrane protein (DUF4010 family)
MLLAAGVALASAVMVLRVGAIVLTINTALVPLVAPPLLVATAVAVAFALLVVYWRGNTRKSEGKIRFKNPFSFWSVVGFAVFIGLVDVDAITVSMARLVPAALTSSHAAIAILVAVTTDTISKIGIGAAIGHGRFALAISAMAFLCIAAGGLAAWLTFGLLV